MHVFKISIHENVKLSWFLYNFEVKKMTIESMVFKNCG